MVAMPGSSYSGALKPLTEDERVLVENLRRHVAAVASREHNLSHPSGARSRRPPHRSHTLRSGLRNRRQRFVVDGKEVRNIEVEVPGGAGAGEVIIVGAHYDSVLGAVGANDNGSGVAAVLESYRANTKGLPTFQ